MNSSPDARHGYRQQHALRLATGMREVRTWDFANGLRRSA